MRDEEMVDLVFDTCKKLAEAYYTDEDHGDRGEEEWNDILPTLVCIGPDDDHKMKVIAFDPQLLEDKDHFFSEIIPQAIEKAGRTFVCGFVTGAWSMRMPKTSFERATPNQLAALRGESMAEMEESYEIVSVTVLDINSDIIMSVAEVHRDPASLGEWEDMRGGHGAKHEGRAISGMRKGLLGADVPSGFVEALSSAIVEELGLDVEDIMRRLNEADSIEEATEVAEDLRTQMSKLDEAARHRIMSKANLNMVVQNSMTPN